MNSRVILGFDYGEKRIGVAVGQTVTQTATPLETVNVYRNKPDWQAIDRLVKTWSPDVIVLGLPLNMDGSHQEITAKTEKFMRQINSRHPLLSVETIDERLSSFEARDRLQKKTNVDAVAAQVIIETWLCENSVPPLACEQIHRSHV